ncbi:MAG: MFS transporter [Fimbriimonas ginsengisoli]|uniref:MFS transporter n=1 Tax=Fimbriimonas ginsengisoli TaxID=1005039 RepID=A0A931LU15_FIMGI|nr:MFS transporter [Fimbriimonas ginsengisoli]
MARLLVIALLAEIGYAVLNISTMQVYLRYDRGFGESFIGLVLVAFLLSEAVFKSPMGHLADRFGRRLLMTLGPAMSVATSLLTILVPHGWGLAERFSFIGLRMIDGLGAAMLWPAAFAAMGDTVEDRDRQQAMSLLNLCYMLGIALALPIGGIVNDLSGNKWASLILSSALFGAVSLSACRLAPTAPPSSPAVGDGMHTDLNVRALVSSARQIPGYLALAVITFMGIGFPMPIIKIFAQDQFGMSESAFGGLVFPGAIAMAVLSVPMSRYAERIGRARAVHVGMGLCAFGLWIVASGAASLKLPALGQAWVFALGGIPVGVGFLLAIPAWMASVSDIDCQRRGLNLGAVMTAQGVGAMIGASSGGVLYEVFRPIGRVLGLGEPFGHYAPFLGCALCVSLGWLLSMRILRAPRAPKVAPVN